MNEQIATEETDRLIASNKVEGTKVFGRDGEKLGTITNFMVGKLDGQVEYAVLEFGGLLGVGTDYYPVPWDVLDYDTEQGGYVVNLDKDQLKEAPRYVKDAAPAYDHAYGREVHDYYDVEYPYV